MSIWGKVIGGVAGFAIGGPLGGILGAAAGHAVDKARAGDGIGQIPGGSADRAETLNTEDRQVAFTVAVIVLAAKMAKADGEVTRDEVDAFKQIFHIPPDEMKTVGKIFDEARQDASGFEPYAQQVADMFSHDKEVLEELLGGLYHIAQADGIIHPGEVKFMEDVAEIFGVDGHAFERIRASFSGGGGAAETGDAYEILGLKPDAADDEIKSTYRKLIRDYHPDKLMSHGLPQEFVDLANEKMAAINAAYDLIAKQRGIK